MTTGADIAAAAREGANGASWAVSFAGWCSRFARQVGQRVGIKGDLWGGNAIQTEQKFTAAGLTLKPSDVGGVAGLRPGDFLFQGFGSPDKNGVPQGHVGVYIGNGQVAQNTTIGTPAGGDGRKILPVSAFGQITSIGRVDTTQYGAYAGGTLPTPFTAATPAVGAPRLVGSGVALPSGVIPTAAAAQSVAQGNQPRSVVEQLNPVSGIWADIKNGAVTYGADVLTLACALLLIILGGAAAFFAK